MVDLISRYISVISIAIASALSIFNIGYYWKIGIHFLGITDLTNLVYSAGLSLTVVAVWGAIAAFIVNRELPNVLHLILVGAGSILAGYSLFRVDSRSTEPDLAMHGLAVLGLAVSTSSFFAWTRRRRSQSGSWEGYDLIVLAITLFITTFEAGAFVAALELSDRVTYVVSTKSTGVIDDARILRSSSSGFLLATPNGIVFIPQGEIKAVNSKAKSPSA
jgi:hypothetical protein